MVCPRQVISKGIVKLHTDLDKLRFGILKLINNLLSLNKGNHDRDSVWIPDLNQHRFLRFCFCVFSLFLVSIEKIYQTLKTVFDHISKHLEVRQKYSAARRIFNSLLGVWKCGQTLSFVFDILLKTEIDSVRLSIKGINKSLTYTHSEVNKNILRY